MDIQFTSRSFELTSAIRQYAEEKFGRATRELDHEPTVKLHVTFEKVGHSHSGDNVGVHVVAFVPGTEPLNVEERHQDLYAAIDIASDRLKRQVIKYKQHRQA